MKIKKITHVGKSDVYNMTVDKYHNYILSNGIVAKNCDALRYYCAGRPYPSREPEKPNYWEADERGGTLEDFFRYGR